MRTEFWPVLKARITSTRESSLSLGKAGRPGWQRCNERVMHLLRFLRDQVSRWFGLLRSRRGRRASSSPLIEQNLGARAPSCSRSRVFVWPCHRYSMCCSKVPNRMYHASRTYCNVRLLRNIIIEAPTRDEFGLAPTNVARFNVRLISSLNFKSRFVRPNRFPLRGKRIPFSRISTFISIGEILIATRVKTRVAPTWIRNEEKGSLERSLDSKQREQRCRGELKIARSIGERKSARAQKACRQAWISARSRYESLYCILWIQSRLASCIHGCRMQNSRSERLGRDCKAMEAGSLK